MKVLILHSLAPEGAEPGRMTDEFDLSSAVNGLRAALPEAAVAGVRGELREVLEVLDTHQPDVVFNACEAPLGRPDLEAHVAALLEWLHIPFTGSGSAALALCRRKDRTSAVLAAAGVPVPRAGVFPCIVKPADEDGSAGIDEQSICENEEELARARARINGPVVIEEYLAGAEYTISLWGKDEPEYFSPAHMEFSNGLRVNTYASKWDIESPDFGCTRLVYDLKLTPEFRSLLEDTARAAWRAVGARGYMRIDLRLDGDGIPRVLDVNPNPELGEDVGIYRGVTEAGWTWEQFVRKQLEWAR